MIPFPASRRGHVPQPRRAGTPVPVGAAAAGWPARAVRVDGAPRPVARSGRLRLTRRGRATVWLLAVTAVALLATLL